MTGRAYTEAEHAADFADALRAAGFRLRAAPLMDGARHRAPVEGDKGAERSGSYRGFSGGMRPAGIFTNFRTSHKGKWKSGGPLPFMSGVQRVAWLRELAAAKAERERQDAARWDAIAQDCAATWAAAAPAPEGHPYLRRKGVTGDELRLDPDGLLLVPMYDFAGQLRSLQTIAADGTKRFPTDGRVHSLHLLLGELHGDGPLLIAEGWATARTLHTATGHAVAVAFTKSNYAGIARAYGERFPGLCVAYCGDNDHHHPRRDPPLPNVGQDAAEAAARDAGGVVILPDFLPDQAGTDWNDYAALHGLDAVCTTFAAAIPPAVPRQLPHYPVPEGTRQDALDALRSAVGGFFRDAERSVAIRRAWQVKLAEMEVATPPKSSGRRAALRDARRQMAALFGQDWRAPGRRLLAPGAAGSGKTALTTGAIAGGMQAIGNVFYATDKTDNAVAVTGQIPGAAVIRGRSQPDPKMPGKAMCWRPKAAEAVARASLPVGRTLCRDAAGRTCPFHGECGYQREAARMRSGEVTVFAGSHEYLTKRGPMPTPEVVVVDESAVGALIGHLEFGFDRLLPTTMEGWQSAGLPEAIAFRQVMVKVRDALPAPGGILAELRHKGIIEAAHLAPAVAYLQAVEDRDFTGGIAPDTDDAQVIELLERHQRSEIGGVLKMLTALQDEIALPRDHAHGVAFIPDKSVKVDDRMERQARVTVHYRKRLAFPADVPVLVLDASGDAEVYRRLLGDRLEVAAAVRCERNAVVVQVRDMLMPRSTLLGANRNGNPLSLTRVARAGRLRAEVVAVADALAARHGSLMLATNKPVEAALLPALGEAVATGHFGGLRGKNDYQDCAAGLILGREQTWPQVPEDAARAIWATDPDPLHMPGAYAKATRSIRMRDGSAVPVEVDIHPDPRVQRVVELHRERESEQAADRLRLIHNAQPKTLYIAGNLPLDMTVDRVVTWPELVREVTGRMDNGQQGKGRRLYGNRLAEAFRLTGGALPLSRTELMRLFGPEGWLQPGLWGSERRLREDMERWPSPQLGLLLAKTATFPPVLIRYRIQGQRGSDCNALVALPGDAGRAALAALVGPLATYAAPAEAVPQSATPSPPPQAQTIPLEASMPAEPPATTPAPRHPARIKPALPASGHAWAPPEGRRIRFPVPISTRIWEAGPRRLRAEGMRHGL